MNDCVFFLHIPKTAGMTFKRILARQYSAGHVHDIPFETYLFQDAIDRYKAASPAERAAIRCVMGHMPFGLHRWAPGRFRYVTFMRDPIERVLSSYEYIRKHTVLKQEIGLPPEAELSMDQYLDFEAAQGLNNLQVRAISGVDDVIDHVLPPFSPLPADALAVALDNIERFFPVVGVVERFDESLLLMRREFGWRRLWYVRRNVSVGRPAASALSEAALARIRQDNALDLELYRFAVERFDRQIRERGPLFRMALWRFHAANRLFRVARALFLAVGLPAIQRIQRLTGRS